MWLWKEGWKNSSWRTCIEFLFSTTHWCHLSWVSHSFHMVLAWETTTLMNPRLLDLLSLCTILGSVNSGPHGLKFQSVLKNSWGMPGKLRGYQSHTRRDWVLLILVEDWSYHMPNLHYSFCLGLYLTLCIRLECCISATLTTPWVLALPNSCMAVGYSRSNQPRLML